MDVYSMVTERIIAELEKGCIPWRKPWINCLEGTFNRITRKPYSLLNQLLLGRPGEWATYKQWQTIGGQVRRGEDGSVVVFWKLKETQERSDNGEQKKKKVPILRYYTVFHSSQVENILPLIPVEVEYDTQPIERADITFREYVGREKIELNIGISNQAYYSPAKDSINLPAMSQFESAEEWYSTAFHEAGHSTMKKSRCDREEENKGNYFGNEGYSREELVAELTSSFILNTLGIETSETFKNNAAYVQNWLRVLKEDKKLIVLAAGKAEKAANYILNRNA